MLLSTVLPRILILSSSLFIQLNAQLDCSREMLKLTLKLTSKWSIVLLVGPRQFSHFISLEQSSCAFSWINKGRDNIKMRLTAFY